MAAPTTGPERARQLVEAISTDLGFVDAETWATLLPNARKKFEYAMRMKDGMISSSVSTLAKNLYTSNARFVFELLQNADDNHFKTAAELGQVPYVAFKVYPDRIVVDCNEDGFTHENLKAICAVGRSSKTGAQGYIGEKGIGFKSVFMAAWKVYILSGDFSFYFQHRIHDPGFGMIRPVWEEPTEQLRHPLTRMTLSLHDQGDKDQLSSQRETIHQQFNDLQENLLLFMRNLKEIRVAFFDADGEMETSTTFSTQQTDANRVTLTKHVTHGGATTTTSKIYYLVRHTVGNLAKNENLSYSVHEEQTRAYSTAEVVLGFPLTKDSVPIDMPQDVFAFLPMSHMGFNAILEFCNLPELQYTWMRFLPNPKDHYDHFWSRLVTKLQANLRFEAVLWPRSEGRLRPITNLWRLLSWHCDSHREPLFRDTNPEIYISNKYQESDLDKLMAYGLEYLKRDKFVDLLEQDLQLESSRMQSIETDDDWHTRVAKLLVGTFESPKFSHLRAKICQLPLLPLQGGKWAASSAPGRVYFSESSGVIIPGRSGFTLLAGEAEGNSTRMDLFKHLGVCHADLGFVRRSIIQWNRAYQPGTGVLFSTLVDQLEFFYLTQHLVVVFMEGKARLRLATHRSTTRLLGSDVFLPDNHEFGLKKILGHENTAETLDGAPEIDFLWDGYLQRSPEKPVPTAESWTDWLCTYAAVRRHISLVSLEEPGSLSKPVHYVAEHMPDKFLGFLCYNWCDRGQEIENSAELTTQLKSIRVLCQDGSTHALEKTYLPFQDLEAECARYLRGEESFPFLKLPTAVERGTYARDWPFLVPRFGVGVDPDMAFYKQLLLQIRSTAAEEVEDEDRLIGLYSTIYGKYVQSVDMELNKTSIQNDFAEHALIFVPSDDYVEASWSQPDNCLWDAPSTFITSHPLESRWEALLASQQDAGRATERLFRDVLEISDCSWRNILEELGCSGYEDDSYFHEIKIQGKTTLAEEYEDLQEFFVDFLGVDTLNLQIVYDELLHLGCSPSTSVNQVKEQIRSLNGLLSDVSSYPKVESELLRKAKIFPVSIPGDEVKLFTGETSFTIVDRVVLGEYFAGQVKTLDFDLNEVREIAPFLQWLGLETRYLSRSDGKDHHEVLSHSDLHLREVGTQLEIFVPRKKKRRQFCYASKLPARLFEWLMTDPNTQIPAGTSEKAHRLVATVLNASKHVVPEILEVNGIVPVDIESEDFEEHDATDYSSESEGEESLRGSPTRDSAAEPPAPYADTTSETSSLNDPTPVSSPRQAILGDITYNSATASEAAGHSHYASPPSVSQRPDGNRPYPEPDLRISAMAEDAAKYRDLLGRVISAARAADLPARPNAPLSMSALISALSEDAESTLGHFEESIHFRSKTKLERNEMIGAAGELYVFELLKTLDPSVPGFSMENWQSTIRHNVITHEEYSGNTPWPGKRETADIVYDDATGALTRTLIDRDYLDASWEHARPNYLLEVKTTTGPCKTPFYMSGSQYQRMQKCRGSRETVYIVLRVFSLDKGRIGLRVYVDPAEKEANGELAFTGGPWAVTPVT
ncbi:hypothetical protein AK830_g7176 [Neonectria ditissima]|uniref:Protein NO VEIN C-terminal domain-containing protein n=1 Tax=Neonectria ditissima TaxID=78410 RepID=A0A0P7BAN8_9HYPO|nr:hypothetical protein AK830_g7176 [Neonectria ditissima]